jgi:hypothetical protein
MDGVDAEIKEHLAEPTADGEASSSYALSRIKLRCFELFKQFDDEGRRGAALDRRGGHPRRRDGPRLGGEAASRDVGAARRAARARGGRDLRAAGDRRPARLLLVPQGRALQADFFAKVQAHHDDPAHNPAR